MSREMLPNQIRNSYSFKPYALIKVVRMKLIHKNTLQH